MINSSSVNGTIPGQFHNGGETDTLLVQLTPSMDTGDFTPTPLCPIMRGQIFVSDENGDQDVSTQRWRLAGSQYCCGACVDESHQASTNSIVWLTSRYFSHTNHGRCFISKTFIFHSVMEGSVQSTCIYNI